MENSIETAIVVEDYPATRPSLRIAVVTETWPPEVNGVAMTLAKLVQGLSHRNHDVQLIRPRQTKTDSPMSDSSLEEVLMRGMPIPRYPELKLGLPSKKTLVKTWTLRRPDVVHIATEGPLGWSALQAAKVLKLPVTSDFRTNFQSYSKHYGVGWLRKPIVAYLRKFHNATACTMVPTSELMRTLSQNGFANLKVVSRGVDTKLFNISKRDTSLRSSWGATDDSKVLISVGRMAPEKNLDQVLKTYEALKSTGQAFKLVMVGDGPLKDQFQKRYPEIIFPGMLTQSNLAAYYASSDLFIFPSQTETFGNVTLEALASGIPVWHLIAQQPEIGCKRASMGGWLQKKILRALQPKQSLFLTAKTCLTKLHKVPDNKWCT